MRIVLEVRNGPRSGHRTWLADGQELKIGRTEWADFAFPDDRTMPDVGVVLKCGTRGCDAKSPSDKHRFLVNGQQVLSHTLKDGDILQVGNTEFLVSVPLAGNDRRISVPLIWTKGPRSSTTIPSFPYEMRRCHSGLVCYRADAARFPIRALLPILARRMILYLLVNGDLAPEEEKAGLAAYREFPRDMTRPDDVLEANLRVVTPMDPVDRVALAARLWPSGCITCVLSSREPDHFMTHLASSAFLLSRHEMLLERLEGATSSVLADAFRGVAAVVLPDSAASWSMFADPQPRPVWQNLGLPTAPLGPANTVSREITDSKRFG